mgnify:CR=1 FL=1
MPLYEYLCEDCHKEFTKVLTLSLPMGPIERLL